MHFTIVGAGAIGGTAGAYLLRGGHAVLFVDQDQAHVEAINRSGLTITGRETFTVRAQAVLPEGLRGAGRGHGPEAVLLCVKAMHTAAAIDALAPILGGTSFVVSFQNGLNEKVIAARIGAQRTVGAFVNFGADYLEPGRVLYGGTGALYLGELDGTLSPRVKQLEEVFRTCFLPHTHATPNIWGYLWGKLGYASLLFATALVDAPIADVLDHAPSHPALANLAAEVGRVAEAEGVCSEGFDGFEPQVFAFRHPRDWTGIADSLSRLVAFNRSSLKQKTGIWRDLVVRKRKTEVDQHVGAVVDTARTHGISVPLNSRLVELIHALEEGHRQMTWENLTALTALNRTAYPDDAEVPVR
jgi:2-dehydropantoate 2-reductase